MNSKDRRIIALEADAQVLRLVLTHLGRRLPDTSIHEALEVMERINVWPGNIKLGFPILTFIGGKKELFNAVDRVRKIFVEVLETRGRRAADGSDPAQRTVGDFNFPVGCLQRPGSRRGWHHRGEKT
ncbi:MAG: hypothetical protein OXI81_00190 [Paracoccaceae bacterium]|nr:hypothetical protein [Paracoccaceae bacterium]